jgi:hypothetical protein
MSRRILDADSKPWYRHFWPWFLMSLPAAVVVAGLSTAFIAYEHADDLVVDDYYKDGLAINQQLAKKKRAANLGLSASLQFKGDAVTVTLTGPIRDSELSLLLSHPVEADRDFAVPLVRMASGTYRGSLDQTVAPHWHWTLQDLRRDDWRLDGVVQAGDFDHVPTG